MPRPPRTRAHAARALNVPAFCREAAHLGGRCDATQMPRLAQSVQRGADGFADPQVEWSVQGSLRPVRGGAVQPVLDLEVNTVVALECQRCLQPMAVPIAVARRFRFVPGEEEAARQDEEAGDEEDVLALTPRLDLHELVEEELLLALPLVPRHEVCPHLPQALMGAGEATGEAGGPDPATGLPAAAPRSSGTVGAPSVPSVPSVPAVPGTAGAGSPTAAEHPFAALAALRRGKG